MAGTVTSATSTAEGRAGSAALRPGSGAMFDRIAGRYDLVNRIMSFGLDRGWRRATVRALGLRPGSRILDLATGTADMALEVLRQEPEAQVIGLDPSSKMLEKGRQKVSDAGLGAGIDRGVDRGIELRQGEAESLPFDDDSFDGVCIAYGIRNVADRGKAIAEMVRVTRPGGRIAILEATEATEGLLAIGARFYVHHVVPRIGALLSRKSEYRYLQDSIAAFPPPPEFVALMQANGARVLESRSMTFGSNGLFIATPKDDSGPSPCGSITDSGTSPAEGGVR